jgi:hypothetical protein
VTFKELQMEIYEKSRDLHAFTEARELIRKRVLEVKDSECKLTPLPNWSGTDAVLGSLDLSIHAIERTLDELKELLSVVEPDEPPRLTVIEGGQE